MILLAVETSTLVGGVALLDGMRLLGESRLNVRVTHSEKLMVEVDKILAYARVTIQDVEVFAVAAGPGSFTGLRVGISTIKGLVHATGGRLVAVPTLEAFAWNLPWCRHDVCPLLDARKGQVYAAIFSWKGDKFVRRTAEQAVRVERLAREITEPTMFLGEGAVRYGETLREILGDKALFGHSSAMIPSPSNVAYLGHEKAMRGEFADPVTLTPFYLRRSEAELGSQHAL